MRNVTVTASTENAGEDISGNIGISNPNISKPEMPKLDLTKPSKILARSIKIQSDLASNKIAAGKKVKLKAVVSPSKAANKSVAWKSSNPKVASVNSSGKVKTKKVGKGKKVKITAMATDGSGKKGTLTIKMERNGIVLTYGIKRKSN